MSFEDDFPSLKGKGDRFLKIEVQECCLDKQNKEAVCEQASKFGMIHSQTVQEEIEKIEQDIRDRIQEQDKRTNEHLLGILEMLKLGKMKLGLGEKE